MNELKHDIFEMLVKYFADSVEANMIDVFVDRAMLAYEEYLNYPSHWTDEQILADMTKHKSCIMDLAMYEAIQQGAEYQTMHIESGLYRMWQSQGSIYTKHRIVPFATV